MLGASIHHVGKYPVLYGDRKGEGREREVGRVVKKETLTLMGTRTSLIKAG